MRYFATFTLFLLSMESFAQRIPDPIPGLQAALQFCMTIHDDDSIAQCVELESTANWVTPEALPICRNQNFDADRISCLRGIVNIQIRPEEVRVCESLNFNDEKAHCLADIRRPFPYRTRIKVDPQPGRDEVANLFTVDAVRFCSEQFTDDNKIQCLGLLKNHFIVREEVILCKKIFNDDQKLSCLSGVQRKYVKTRP